MAYAKTAMKPAHDLSQYWIVTGGRRKDWRNGFRHFALLSLPQLRFCGTDFAQTILLERTSPASAWPRKCADRRGSHRPRKGSEFAPATIDALRIR